MGFGGQGGEGWEGVGGEGAVGGVEEGWTCFLGGLATQLLFEFATQLVQTRNCDKSP